MAGVEMRCISTPSWREYFSREVVGKLQDVGFALAQGRNEDGKDIEPVEEILAESPLGDGFFQIYVGRRDDANIYRHRAAATKALDFAILQHAEAV